MTPSSCQAGGVVHILAANGAKLPVTLKMSAREDAVTNRTTHIVQVRCGVCSCCLTVPGAVGYACVQLNQQESLFKSLTAVDLCSCAHCVHINCSCQRLSPAVVAFCQVTKATEGARLDQRRLLLSVNHNGIILQVNPGRFLVQCWRRHSASCLSSHAARVIQHACCLHRSADSCCSARHEP
jgi:hypothetical protein